MINLISRWFKDQTLSQDYRLSDYFVLMSILIVGAVIRFVGLNNVGLHGDEETMAMPAMAILETGSPVLPSGMFYGRALLNVYLMSWAVSIFGESEWAFRLPSAIVGSISGLTAFYMGRRFLSPQFNLAFVATIALLPVMIEVSQTARMYVFFITCTIWFAACIFRWERDQRTLSLCFALLVWTLCLHFHTLAVFIAPLFFFPGISRQSWKQLLQGGCALAVATLLFAIYDYWIATKYPQGSARPPSIESSVTESPLDVLISGSSWIVVLGMVAIASLATIILLKFADRKHWLRSGPVLMVLIGLLMMVFLQYHIGGIFLLIGVIFWFRTPYLSKYWLVVGLVLAFTLMVIHLGLLNDSGIYPGRKILGALVGVPSIWPVLRFLEYSPAAAVLYGAVLIFASVKFCSGQRLPMHILFFLMAVWAPLFVIGFFRWDVPSRYTQGQLSFFLLCVFAGIAYLLQENGWLSRRIRSSRVRMAVVTLLSVAIINPVALARAISPGYEEYPDHKGAAEYIQSQNLPDNAILIAEDILQQTYYLGEVDYWLREKDNSYQYSIDRDGNIVDQYTGAITIGTGKELEYVLDRNPGSDLYVIGSGENFVDDQPLFRGSGISEVLESDRLEVIFTGRDAKTKIWKRLK